MYFTIKKAAVWILLVSIQIAIVWAQTTGEYHYPQKDNDPTDISVLVDAAKSKVDSWCEYLFCGG